MSTWTFKQETDQAVTAGPNGTSTTSLTWGTNTTAGTLQVCVVTWTTSAGRTISSITDTAGTPNTWVSPQGSIAYGANQFIQLFYVLSNTTGGARPVVTTTWSGTAVTNYQMSLVEYQPYATGLTVVDQLHTTATGTSTNPVPGTVNTTYANELVIIYGGTGVAETWTAGTGYALRTTSASRGNGVEDFLLAGQKSIGGVGITIGASVAWGCGIITFEPGASLVINNPVITAAPGVMANFTRGANGQLALGDVVGGSAGGYTVFNAG